MAFLREKKVTMAESTLGGIIVFFRELGVYDVVLPFILTFTIMFAILERTQILGVTKTKDEPQSRKNLNAMVSFVVGFMVVASSQLVSAITKVSSELILVLLLIVFFMMLVGVLRTHEELKEGKLFGDKDRAWQIGFMVVVAVSIALIFLDAITTADGTTWLEHFMDWLAQFYTNSAVAAIILIIAIIIFMVWITREPAKE